MVLWILFAMLAAAVVWAVTRPLLARSAADPAADSELAVYRDQLAEIETERAQGLLGEAEAEGARVELARRLIRRSEEANKLAGDGAAKTSAARKAVLYLGSALPVIGIAVYLGVGSPQLPGRPYGFRMDVPVEQATASDLVARVEEHLRANPEDGRGWDVLAPVYLRLGRFNQAADAFQRANQLLGESPGRIAGYARSMIMAQNGVVSEPVRRAYERLKVLDPKAMEAEVWLAIGREQDGDRKGAEAEFRRLLATAEDPWKTVLTTRLEQMAAQQADAGARARNAPGGAAAAQTERSPAGGETVRPGDSAAPAAAVDANEIAALDPAQRAQRIAQMVQGLAARLKENGSDLDGWKRLVRSYVVLGQRNDAQTALTDARSNFATDRQALTELNELAQTLELGS
ncbi:c-type cytochrome biogenesis protein CcmI [Hyphomicrobium sp. D-2]|uniref:c-type cytochrome biogenesis protein CcmI n=1 Tax=Hyphomicrobium sp. D-2 TaxID=3041621 RepID=UPI0024541851|nr:c-type cytochrome biogenesis protein CcmI [Hyphomicrobium sp. D-2]MDH4981315.1 c-type cytochrome biogenesis protein CcmI [Hyphomicrobium sp. D-2]